MKKTNLTNVNLDELITPEFTQYYSYIDLDQMGIQYSEVECQETELLLRIPFQEELYPYNRAMFDFLNEMEMHVPRGCRAKSYLREREMLGDFYSFWHEGSKAALLEWFQEKNIAFSPGA